MCFFLNRLKLFSLFNFSDLCWKCVKLESMSCCLLLKFVMLLWCKIYVEWWWKFCKLMFSFILCSKVFYLSRLYSLLFFGNFNLLVICVKNLCVWFLILVVCFKLIRCLVVRFLVVCKWILEYLKWFFILYSRFLCKVLFEKCIFLMFKLWKIVERMVMFVVNMGFWLLVKLGSCKLLMLFYL